MKIKIRISDICYILLLIGSIIGFYYTLTELVMNPKIIEEGKFFSWVLLVVTTTPTLVPIIIYVEDNWNKVVITNQNNYY